MCNPLGGVGRRQPAYPAMRPHVVVVIALCPQPCPRVAQGRERPLVKAFVAQATMKAVDLALLLRVARRDMMPFDPPVLRTERRIARQVSSVPLSFPIISGLPRITMTAFS